MVYAYEKGNMRKLHHGVDYHGNICGVGEGVADKPFLYWCADAEEELDAPVAPETQANFSADAPVVPAVEANSSTPRTAVAEEAEASSSALRNAATEEDELARRRRLQEVNESRLGGGDARGDATRTRPEGANASRVARIHEWMVGARNFTLNLQHPMCVEACPTNGSQAHFCFHNISLASEKLAGGTGTYVEKTTYHFRLVQDYKTIAVAHYCLPEELSIRRSLGTELDDSQEALMYHVQQVWSAWPAILATAGFAVALGFAYLCILGLCPGALIFTTLAGAIILPLVAGGFSLWGWYKEDQQHDFLEEHVELKLLQLPATGDSTEDLAISLVLIILGLGVAATAWCMMSSIKLAIGSVDGACECLMGVPSILFEPFIHVAFQLTSLAVLVWGFAMLISCGEVSHTSHISLTYMRGISRSFIFHDIEYLYLVLYVPLAAWVWEFGLALEKFVLAHATQQWYFTEYHNGRKHMPSCALLQGICVAMTYHLGTLALGSLCIPPFRLMHWVHSRFLKRRGMDSDDEPGSEVSECVLSCCTCCWACWEGLIKFMHSDAYIAVAIDSYPFFPASQKAYVANLYQIERLGDPNSFMWIFQSWGILVIAGLSAFFTWCITTTFEDFTEEKSPHYVENPMPIAVVGGLLGLIVAMTFMHVLKNIADTIAFCYALDREWHEERGLPMRGNVPPALESYMKSTGLGHRFTSSAYASPRALMRGS